MSPRSVGRCRRMPSPASNRPISIAEARGRTPPTAGCAPMSRRRRDPTASPRKATFAAGSLVLAGAIVLLNPGLDPVRPRSFAAQEPKPLDPAAWGRDHVGEHVPEHVTGDECLFFHRPDTGPAFAGHR